jgi:hypothetical protein
MEVEFRERSRLFREHLLAPDWGRMRRGFREYEGRIQGTWRGNSGNICDGSGSMRGGFREHGGGIQRAFTDSTFC